MNECARFWAVDLHVHTPASRDVTRQQYGATLPAEIVAAAVAAGLDAIAVTDHNTADWCEAMAEAAAGSRLIVLPGVEITTTEGHLLALWDEHTPARELEDCLTRLDISGTDRGQLDINASKGFAESAEIVSNCGGVAIAAHADAAKGLLALPVASHVKRTLLNEALSAVELVDAAKLAEVQRKVGADRELAFVRGSDAIEPGQPGHRVSAIGRRRCWIKAARPDLAGLRHAFDDPGLRISLDDPRDLPPHPHIASLRIVGGFMDGVELPLSADLNCLVGGTGAGKSLALECVRFVLEQQVDRNSFPQIADEVEHRLADALGNGGAVELTATLADGRSYYFERVYDSRRESRSIVSQILESGDRVAVQVEPEVLLPISAFSQGEALEYSRHSVGRMALVDAGCDLSEVSANIDALIEAIRRNGTALLKQRDLVSDLRSRVVGLPELEEQIADLERLFDSKVVKDQKAWQQDDSLIAKVLRSVPQPGELTFQVEDVGGAAQVAENARALASAHAVAQEARQSVAVAITTLNEALSRLQTRAAAVNAEWQTRYQAFKVELQETLAAAPGRQSLIALKDSLERLRGDHMRLQDDKARLSDVAEPELERLRSHREALVTELMKARTRRRELRRERVKALNSRMSGIVKLDVPATGDRRQFREHLERLKVGSRVREDVLDAISANIHPAQFAAAMLDNTYSELANPGVRIELESLSRLYVNVSDRSLWTELIDLQSLDTPDTLSVKFRREEGDYVAVESLAHGQRCTAMLVSLVADGDSPVIVDQPEDALHAPWIEEHLVDRLRSLRGSRQYIFATRSPGLVVSADAEQIITLKATAGRGRIEACGSLERHDLNKLVLHHLEGGPVPFRRRGRKLSTAVREI